MDNEWDEPSEDENSIDGDPDLVVGVERTAEVVSAPEVEVCTTTIATADVDEAESDADSLEDLLDYISEGKPVFVTLCCVCDAAGGGAFIGI